MIFIYPNQFWKKIIILAAGSRQCRMSGGLTMEISDIIVLETFKPCIGELRCLHVHYIDRWHFCNKT